MAVLKTLQRNLGLLLENGFNPHKDNTTNKEPFLVRKPEIVASINILNNDQAGYNILATAFNNEKHKCNIK